ncbi:hypothetical protein K435DRAFT_784865 [Dendrothele bispora CBS 962.96]|uniref:Uncharacterized protein n=1 Tax=Dendrothele bispora (strain CBS 962.96) TaxID=1314807 RepID=A0A4S8L0A9_DENBC|nr:hypothetical protein K435DRAFT_786863 [Dendrothele bispora CBS 962.96]THU81822.1 hypothetical protein K435DRAFT_784865 [Dendrothele bispora CBS 962.96]
MPIAVFLVAAVGAMIEIHALTSTTLDFMVDARPALFSPFQSAPSVFPSDTRWKQDGREANVSISHPGVQCDTHCVFLYH